MRHLLVIPIILSTSLPAEDVPAPAPSAVPASNWEWKSKLGVFFQNISSHNAENSRDPSIAGTSDSVNYKLTGDATAIWKEDKDRVEQKVEASYGQIKEGDAEWIENTDSILYTATYERTLVKLQFLYGNATVESVFSGKDPDNKPFDPAIAKLSAGYGHRYENLLPETDSLIWRVGVFVRKRWESAVPDYQTQVVTGPEWYVRYERQQTPDISYFGQYDGSSEFSDIEHVTNLAQAGLSVKVAKLLTVEFKIRSYYETRPTAAERSDPGYNEWSMRQEALVGLVWDTGSAN